MVCYWCEAQLRVIRWRTPISNALYIIYGKYEWIPAYITKCLTVCNTAHHYIEHDIILSNKHPHESHLIQWEQHQNNVAQNLFLTTIVYHFLHKYESLRGEKESVTYGLAVELWLLYLQPWKSSNPTAGTANVHFYVQHCLHLHNILRICHHCKCLLYVSALNHSLSNNW